MAGKNTYLSEIKAQHPDLSEELLVGASENKHRILTFLHCCGLSLDLSREEQLDVM